MARDGLWGGTHNTSSNDVKKIAFAIDRATDLFTATVTKNGRITEGDGIHLSGGENVELALFWSEAVWLKDKTGFKLQGLANTSVEHENGTKTTTLIWNNLKEIKDGDELYITKGTVQNYLRVENLEQTLKRRLEWKSSQLLTTSQ